MFEKELNKVGSTEASKSEEAKAAFSREGGVYDQVKALEELWKETIKESQKVMDEGETEVDAWPGEERALPTDEGKERDGLPVDAEVWG